MTVFEIISTLLGGIGLFLLGMWLMTDGLKLAAGALLRNVLAKSTHTPLRGIATGAGLTATVQSSSAVTVATVGFVNAGLLTLLQAVWIIYGSNIGTTMTGWIVALTGVEIKLDAYALPVIGVGMLIRLSKPHSKSAAYGQALAGFALFLLGIQALKTGFSDVATGVDFSALPQGGLSAVAVYFGIGVVLTFLVQSSSATSAIAISATAAGMVPVEHAALVIIGADLGTSSTAALSALGATSNARRAAGGHVVLNVVTAAFAVAFLGVLIPAASWLQGVLSLPSGPGVTVAMFSSMFNVVGVLLMIPFTKPMVRMLEGRFASSEEDLARPRHIDATVLEVPELAVRGLGLEVQRLGSACLELASESTGGVQADGERLARKEKAIKMLAEEIRAGVSGLNRARLSKDVADDVPALLRALQHYEEVLDLAVAGTSVRPVRVDWYANLHASLVEKVRAAFAASDTSADTFEEDRMMRMRAEADAVYETMKAKLLEAAADREIAVADMDDRIEEIARMHRAVERATKAASRLAPHLPPAREEVVSGEGEASTSTAGSE
jgi:phosphate:Na+ symporter